MAPTAYQVLGAQAVAMAALLAVMAVADALGPTATAVPRGRSMAPAATKTLTNFNLMLAPRPSGGCELGGGEDVPCGGGSRGGGAGRPPSGVHGVRVRWERWA
ncbi:hypothetical protein Sme01_20710 [Sphaerisporangium melleum]|uniref:Uncharacterized protein n=1 Tax=Sphaerisporangium melleum TaxID=321316 RepID=A0A917VGU3_9ACTN|nr:hypothetical protein GCM10007964_19240 [Sphaerisporangium melleum]GII69595.1 hypothetical protein Sme01_20710 [Sphaerisporangium melleum]